MTASQESTFAPAHGRSIGGKPAAIVAACLCPGFLDFAGMTAAAAVTEARNLADLARDRSAAGIAGAGQGVALPEESRAPT